FNRAIGARASAMEHLVPEMMFSTEDDPAHGISAVKALALAAEQGQRIWTITSDNLDIALPSLSLATETKTDIRNAVRAGKVVTAHEARINFHGWIGEGYMVIDPNTGAGAYMIAGGSNGGFIIFAQDYTTNLNMSMAFFFVGVTKLTRTILGLFTSGAVAKTFGTVTVLDLLRSLPKGGIATLNGVGGTIIAVALNVFINTIVAGAALIGGIGFGSLISAFPVFGTDQNITDWWVDFWWDLLH
ncbi:hypothetical protein, partial [Desulfatitalea alkaliphila]